jgi:hypothetical protein
MTFAGYANLSWNNLRTKLKLKLEGFWGKFQRLVFSKSRASAKRERSERNMPIMLGLLGLVRLISAKTFLHFFQHCQCRF